ncbi:5-methyltetrahydropteroyltriglutamate--homocysteine methyltransferase [Frankliniella fusca]|uniref:5-methyltetrahydropteroyltriglutamate--homocysteine methyltransferase n=1 Tax=Frankliniella fusca TaxID=407009 RepID=A0AAE1H7B1_9NEOP|nr:5-methyltetrahydropteroyltriglutamate--homocysteine methyltransferase [Frankliniella fusca]
MHEDATTARGSQESLVRSSSMSSAASPSASASAPASPLGPEPEPESDPADTVELQVAFSSSSNSEYIPNIPLEYIGIYLVYTHKSKWSTPRSLVFEFPFDDYIVRNSGFGSDVRYEKDKKEIIFLSLFKK